MALDIYWTVLLVLILTILFLTSRTLALRFVKSVHDRWVRFPETQPTSHSEDKAVQQQTTSLLFPSPDTPPLAPPPPSTSPLLPPTTDGASDKNNEVSSFRRSFLTIYLLVMTPETLAGPYLWSLLRDEKGLPESTIAALFATAYASAAVSALGVGFLADRFGRRRACLVQCGFHVAACLTVVFGGACLPVLFVGRVLAGVGLTLLWSVFESWMVTEWNARGLENDGGGGMSEMFGMMTLWNCACAIMGGVLCHSMVSIFGSKMWPFATAIMLQALAAVLILRNMNENYGVTRRVSSDRDDDEPEGRGRIGDARIWALTLVTCCFEGATFLVVFLWPSVLNSAHNDALADQPESNPEGDSDIPYGVISGALMAAMIIGALSFNTVTSSNHRAGDCSARTPVRMLLAAVVVAGTSLLSLGLVRGEAAQLCMFVLFEVANGVYTPSMAYIRGLVVEEKSRAGLYGLMKIPLFVFVILALGVTAGDTRSKRYIFASAAVSLLLAVLGLTLGFFGTLGFRETPVQGSDRKHLCSYNEILDTMESIIVVDTACGETAEK